MVKAREVMRRYKQGERNFQNMNLCGANLQRQDLSRADFSGADIRSTNFNDSNLQGVNFSNAKAGLQRRWIVIQWGLAATLGIVVGVLQAVVGAFSAGFLEPTNFDNTLEQVIGIATYLLVVIFTYAGILLQGFSLRALYSTLSALILSIALVFAYAFIFRLAFPGVGALTGIVTAAITFVLAFSGAVAVAGSSSTISVFIGISCGAGLVSIGVSDAVVLTSLVVSTAVGLVFALFIAWRVFKEDEKFGVLRASGLVIAAIGGTSFSGTDLTSATFASANLPNSSFSHSRKNNTCLTHVCWKGVEHLNRMRVRTSILQDYRVRSLLTTPEKGYKQDLSNVNLRGANLSGVTLEQANLTRAILSNALLKNTVLKDAVLTEAQAVGADFTSACLTGATIEAWNIDSTTIFKNIDCDYVYLLAQPDAKGDRERRPHDPNKIFQPGDFEKLFKEIQDDVQILIRNGGDPVALRSAFKKIRENYPDLPEDTFQGFQRRDNDVLVTLKVPPGTDKAKFERDWDSGYQAGLQAGREESAALLASAEKRADSMEAIALTIAQNPATVHNTQTMTGQDNRQNIEVGGNVKDSIIGQGDDNRFTNADKSQSKPD